MTKEKDIAGEKNDGKSFRIDDLEDVVESNPKIDGWVESLIFNDYIEDVIDVNKRMAVRFRTLTAEETLDVKMRLADVVSKNKDVTRDYVDTQNIMFQLSYSIQDINGKPIGSDIDEKVSSLGKKPALLIDSFWKKYQVFMGEISKALEGVDITKK